MIRVVLLDYASDGLCNRFVVPGEVECLISTRGSRKDYQVPRWYVDGCHEVVQHRPYALSAEGGVFKIVEGSGRPDSPAMILVS
jgi:hypothetical protein